MRRNGFAIAVLLAGAVLATGCKDRVDTASNTAVLGGYGPAARGQAAPTTAGRLADGIPAPPVPRNTTPEVAMVGPATALALWEAGGDVMATRYTREHGWDKPQALDPIGGQASDPRLASNGSGVAMAVWRHSVGNIDSLRYSRYEAAHGWGPADVMPGALPRPRLPGKTVGRVVDEAAPRIEVDAAGNARAQWRSGFNENELQASTFVSGEGWARPVDLPILATAQQTASQ